MTVDTHKKGSEIIVRSKRFYGGIDFQNTGLDKLLRNFEIKGFKVKHLSNEKLIISKGTIVNNLFAFKMSNLNRTITISIVESDNLEIESVVDITGQSIRKSEMHFFTLEVEDIIRFIQNKEDCNRAVKQDRRVQIGNYLILSIMILFCAGFIYLLVSIFTSLM